MFYFFFFFFPPLLLPLHLQFSTEIDPQQAQNTLKL